MLIICAGELKDFNNSLISSATPKTFTLYTDSKSVKDVLLKGLFIS